MTGHLSARDLERLRRAGVAPLPTQRALALLDEALGSPDALVVPIRLELSDAEPDALGGPAAGRAATGPAGAGPGTGTGTGIDVVDGGGR